MVDLARPMERKDWFKEPQFYQVAAVYMATRLFVNLSQAYIPLYLQESLELESKFVAIIPLVMYCSGFVASFGMKVIFYLIFYKLFIFLGVEPSGGEEDLVPAGGCGGAGGLHLGLLGGYTHL